MWDRASLWKTTKKLSGFNFFCCIIRGTWSMTDG
jgi:hypothetical protein